MSLIQFLPAVLRELVKHVPVLALDLTDWGSVKRDLPLVSSRLFTKSGVDALIQAHQKRIGSLVRFSTQSHPDESGQERKAKGDALLRYYFAQLLVPEGVFLDLRDRNLGFFEGRLIFHPTGLWFKLSDPFREGLCLLYRGFYHGDDSVFEAGLEATGLLKRSWPTEDQNRIKNLFRAHFGESLEHPMKFELAHFQETFVKIFQFLIEKKVKLPGEFMLFGLLLVTLYLSLESYGTSHLVKSLYLEACHEFDRIKANQTK